MAARQDISEEAFKGVDPMKGAIKLVKGLVSLPIVICDALMEV
jgi:hypothetical protein